MTESDNILIGRNRDGEKVYAHARFEYAGNQLWRETTAHTLTTERLRLAFGGVIISKYGNIENDRCWRGCGQTTDALLELVQLEPGWTVADVVQLHEIWTRWHLNDMRGACDHQRPYKLGELCPETGYKCGSKWLYEPLPYDVFAWVSDRFEIEPPTPGSLA